MLPKSSRHFIRPAAEELNCSDQLVDDVVGFFYSEVRKCLVEMRSPNIQIENIGSFKAKPAELPKLVRQYQSKLQGSTGKTMNQKIIERDIRAKLMKVQNMMSMIEQERARRKQFLEEKNERIQKNMAKPKSDS